MPKKGPQNTTKKTKRQKTKLLNAEVTEAAVGWRPRAQLRPDRSGGDGRKRPVWSKHRLKTGGQEEWRERPPSQPQRAWYRTVPTVTEQGSAAP